MTEEPAGEGAVEGPEDGPVYLSVDLKDIPQRLSVEHQNTTADVWCWRAGPPQGFLL